MSARRVSALRASGMSCLALRTNTSLQTALRAKPHTYVPALRAIRVRAIPLQRFAQRNNATHFCVLRCVGASFHSKDLRNATQIDSRAPPLATRSPLAVWACAWCAASARLRAQREPRATRPRSATTACAPRSAAVAAAPIAQRSARSSQPPRRYAVLTPASPTPTWCRRSSGVVGLRLLVGAEAVARNPECARWRAGALACMALLMLQDRGGLGPRQSCDAERGP